MSDEEKAWRDCVVADFKAINRRIDTMRTAGWYMLILWAQMFLVAVYILSRKT